MPKATGLPSLNLSAPKHPEGLHGLSPATLSPRSTVFPQSPGSAPGSPLPQATPMTHPLSSPQENGSRGQSRNGPASPHIVAIPDIPPSPVQASPRHGREPSKSFFSNLMASKSSHKLNVIENGSEPNEKAAARSRASSKDRSLHHARRQESTPEVPKNNNTGSPNGHIVQDTHANGITAELAPTPVPQKQKGRSKLGGILTRSRTIKQQDEGVKQKAQPPAQLKLDTPAGNVERSYDPPPKTAPAKSDHRERAFGAENGSTARNQSADRHVREDMPTPKREDSTGGRKDRPAGGNMPSSHSFRDGPTLHLLSNIQQTSKGVGDRLGKAGKGFFGKITRSGSSTEREQVTDDTYVCTTINLPLVKQTRKTRIARKLEKSKDKTEFWMPALPWRCIDYLNMNGCEEEGLYRIPGSGKDVKHWQRRFDVEFDINLFDEPDLYDINTIGSMFKSWLRELPDEILPKVVQNRVASQCLGATRTPQLFKDELSKLPPFNYYLLFAITCHLSLLNSFADKNKMDYRNLCICFQPCLKIDAFCFQFLVMDWKNCWQGCWTEKEYLEEEYRYEREGSVNESEDLAVDERAISSSGSSQHVPIPPKSADAAHLRKSSMPPKLKQRSQSTSAGNRSASASSHSAAQSMPSVPRLVTTPEPYHLPEQQLPELSNISPIRM